MLTFFAVPNPFRDAKERKTDKMVCGEMPQIE
jgi:hypothetical protein